LDRVKIPSGATPDIENAVSWTNVNMSNESFSAVDKHPTRSVEEMGLSIVVIGHRLAMTGGVAKVA
jgi:hypothetical protein